MADTSGWITIKQMAKEILFETDRDEGFYKKCIHHVINGVREMNKFHYDNVKTIKVTCNSLGVIDLSTDATDFVEFVGLYMNYGGQMYPLTRNDRLITTTTDGEQDNDIGEGVALDTGGDYGYSTIGGKNDYYYTLVERDQQIWVSNSPTRTFYLQYISSGIDLDDGNATTIPVKIKEALKWYVLYKDALVSDFGNKQLVALYKQEYHEERSKLEFLELPNAYELLDILYETYSEVRR